MTLSEPNEHVLVVADNLILHRGTNPIARGYLGHKQVSFLSTLHQVCKRILFSFSTQISCFLPKQVFLFINSFLSLLNHLASLLLHVFCVTKEMSSMLAILFFTNFNGVVDVNFNGVKGDLQLNLKLLLSPPKL